MLIPVGEIWRFGNYRYYYYYYMALCVCFSYLLSFHEFVVVIIIINPEEKSWVLKADLKDATEEECRRAG